MASAEMPALGRPDHYLRDEESGTVWPAPWGTDEQNGVEWRLRYGPGQDLFAASCVAAYAALVDPHSTMDEAIKKLRHARRAMALCLHASDEIADDGS